MNKIRIQLTLAEWLFLLVTLSLLPLYNVNAQESNEIDSVSATSSAEVVSAETDQKITTDPRELGYVVEGIPGGGEVIGDFVVGPGKIDVEIEPGQTKVVEISATNRTGVDRIFSFETEDTIGSIDGSDAIILLGNDKGPYSLKDYLEIPENGILIKHNQRVRIPVRVSIPGNAEPGGLYGSVLVQTITLPKETEAETSAVAKSPLITRIGTLFFVTVKGEITRDAVARSFSTTGNKKIYNSGPIEFSLVYENLGSIHTTPYGEINITNYVGESVGFIELDPWFVMPKSLRLREITWNRELLVGKYVASARINRGYDNIIDEFTYEFWVIPWKLVASTFAGFFVFFFILRFFFKRFEFKRKN